MLIAPRWCWIMKVRKYQSKACPLALLSVSICAVVSMPGIMPLPPAVPMADMSMPA